ncbi:MAG: DUF1232 domain-containing protein [Alphaproteobacteria bacterium]|nr:MAG: DUF1232 domain-containing protein [Alphaproteobacteria bacterium]
MGKKRGLLKFWFGWRWLKNEGSVLWRALWDKDTPTAARVAALGVIVYVVSPIDIIPDFIPFLGWVDDLVVIPLGIAFVRRLVPHDVWLRSGGTVEERGRKLRDVTPRMRK